MEYKHIGVFGGTFDPIHNGHIAPTLAAANLIGLNKVLLVPCHVPPHKSAPSVTAANRLNMVKLAAAASPVLAVDDIELKKDAPSYTVNTLRSLRLRWPQSHLYFVMGMDSLVNFESWFQWESILTLSNLIVCQRGNNLKPENLIISDTIRQRIVTDVSELKQHQCGKIYLAPTPLHAISSTGIREAIKNGAPWKSLVPDAVASYIIENRLYQ